VLKIFLTGNNAKAVVTVECLGQYSGPIDPHLTYAVLGCPENWEAQFVFDTFNLDGEPELGFGCCPEGWFFCNTQGSPEYGKCYPPAYLTLPGEGPYCVDPANPDDPPPGNDIGGGCVATSGDLNDPGGPGNCIFHGTLIGSFEGQLDNATRIALDPGALYETISPVQEFEESKLLLEIAISVTEDLSYDDIPAAQVSLHWADENDNIQEDPFFGILIPSDQIRRADKFFTYCHCKPPGINKIVTRILLTRSLTVKVAYQGVGC